MIGNVIDHRATILAAADIIDYRPYAADPGQPALAVLLRGIAERHEHDTWLGPVAWSPTNGACKWCHQEAWPCPDVLAAYAVADAVTGGESE